MIKKLWLGALSFGVFLIQTTVLRNFSIIGTQPNLMVVLVICFALAQQSFFAAMYYGLLCGFMLDCASQTVFGLHTILCVLCAALCFVMNEKFFKAKYLVCLLFVFVVSKSQTCFQYFCAYFKRKFYCCFFFADYYCVHQQFLLKKFNVMTVLSYFFIDAAMLRMQSLRLHNQS